MAWKKELVTIVRILVNDLNSPFVYSDNRLQQVIVVAAHFVKTDLSFGSDYSVHITQPDIIPDPTEPIGKDEPFVNSVALKAACLIDQSTFRSKAAMEGITAALGPASLSVGGNLEGFRILLNEGPCALYEKFVSDFEIANATNIRAILSPFVGNRFDPEMLPYTNDRGRNLYS